MPGLAFTACFPFHVGLTTVTDNVEMGGLRWIWRDDLGACHQLKICFGGTASETTGLGGRSLRHCFALIPYEAPVCALCREAWLITLGVPLVCILAASKSVLLYDECVDSVAMMMLPQQ